MSYAKDTILVRDEPKGDKFDKVRVIGQSPISSAAAVQEWGGNSQSDLLIVEPIGNNEFSATEIVPIDALNSQFSVEFEPDPEPTHVESTQNRRVVRQLSPEEQFRIAAKNDYDEEKTRDAIERQRTPIRHRGR